MSDHDPADDAFTLDTLKAAVDNQITDGYPREAGLVMLALTSQGVERDAALAMMADVLAEHIGRAMDKDQPFDINAYVKDLLGLSQ